MRILLASAAAIALSGCSWLGLGSNNNYNGYGYNAPSAYKAQTAYNTQNVQAGYDAPSAYNTQNVQTGYNTQNVQAGYNTQTDYNTQNVQTHYNGYQSQQSAPKACNSGQCLSRWNIEAAVGPTFAITGDAITGDEANPFPGTNLNNISTARAYDTGVRAELGGSYALNPNRKVTGNVFVEHAESSGSLDWGTVAGEQFTGALSDYTSYGAEVGLRQYFAPRRAPLIRSLRPYVEAKLGATYLEDISIENSQLGGAEFSATDVPFYDNGWVGSAAGLVGVETPLTKYSTIALETGIRYTQGPASDSSALVAGSPIGGTNNGGSRTTIPVMLRGRYRF